ncbi:MAG: ABC transporter ATP-binding protein [Oscillospiraceae bacterium]|nr:ABC transporter ATP-binding protein [Oscillospiraceae bacterium]
MLLINNLTIKYGTKTIIDNVSLELKSNEIVALLGLNGSGKTTLLKGLCGLLPISNGEILINDNNKIISLTKANEKQRANYISFIPQRHSKLIGVTVINAVLMGLNARLGIFEQPTADDKKLTLEALEKMNIQHLANDVFSELSEGQKQLVVLARTLVQNTPVMLMDEPDSALDFSNTHSALSNIRKLVHNENKTCLITLHDPNLALSYCDRIILIDKGKIVSELLLKETSRDDITSCLSKVYKYLIWGEQLTSQIV